MSDKDIIIQESKDNIRQKGVDFVLPQVNHAIAKLNQIINAAGIPLPPTAVSRLNEFEKSITDRITVPKLRETFNIPKSVNIINGQNFAVPVGDQRDEELYKSTLGTPVYANIEFLAGEYETNKTGIFRKFGALRYDAVLINVSQGKRIVKTEIQGRNGTVKEYIGDDDYHVTVNGVVTASNGISPANQVIELKKMLNAPIPIQVACAYLQHLGIFNLVVEGYELGQQPGGYSYQTFIINCISDEPQELRITQV